MAGKIDNLKEIASIMENEANIMKKGIDVLEYWIPNNNSRRIEETQQVLMWEKRISGTYKKYILLWFIMIIVTVVICIKLI